MSAMTGRGMVVRHPAPEAVKRIDAIFDIEREINGLDAEARLAARQVLSRLFMDNLHDWLQEERAKLSGHNKVAKAINYISRKRAAGRPSRPSLRAGAPA